MAEVAPSDIGTLAKGGRTNFFGFLLRLGGCFLLGFGSGLLLGRGIGFLLGVLILDLAIVPLRLVLLLLLLLSLIHIFDYNHLAFSLFNTRSSKFILSIHTYK